ncbi:tyrosine-type recombinase/integrase [Micromonospora sp. WMMA1363]|uniref:tyrosine-type recombinase/integrase n=1 Tax=Micromonospora sp. WMMA1363 TaxID=3053985 RepID=UPI00259D0E9A|nr:site-specific integrase [Micromonospora sp. WMMA1363]MDM4721026.1 tyrosine-type recombinase/integrase [Micromonospora sp. WMMA1363]
MAGRKRANGEGTVYQRADGRWEGAGYVQAADGSSRRVRVYGATRKEAADKLAVKLADSHRGLPATADPTLTVADYLTRWLTTVVVHQVRPTTYANYDTYVRQFLIPALGHRRLAALTVTEVRTFLDTIQSVCQCCARGWDTRRDPHHPRKDRRPRCCAVGACCQRHVKPATVRYIRAVLSAALAHAVREELLHRNVASPVRLPTPARSRYQPFTAREARKYLYAAAFHRHGPLFELALRTGMRRGEILGLQWSDIDLEAGHLSVRRTLARTKGGMTFQPPKTEASQRRILLPRDCITSLTLYRQRQAVDRRKAGDTWADLDLVFASTTGGPLDPANVHRQHETICYLAEVRYIRFHDLRHTCATLLLEQGVELVTIKELLGHARLHVTADIYAHIRPRLHRNAIEAMNRALHPDDTDPDDDTPPADN